MKGSTIMTKEPGNVGGVHSHQDTIHVAVNTGLGREVDDREFPTSTAGYRRAVAWLIGHGPLQAVGVNGTSSYGGRDHGRRYRRRDRGHRGLPDLGRAA